MACALAWSCSPELGLEGIRSQQEAGQFAPTIEPLRKLLESTPDDPELNHLYGLALLQTRRPDLAIWPLRKAAQDPDRAIEDGLLLARALLRGGSSEDGVEAANQVLELAPDRVDALRFLIEARLTSRQHEEVLEDAERLLALEPEDPQALIARLAALLSLERVDEAEQALAAAREAITDREGEPDWQPRLCAASATFAEEQGDAAEAETQWNACLEQFPGEETIVFGGIEFFGERAQPARCLEILRRALDANPTHLPFIQALAHRLGASGHSAEAEELLRAATRDGVNERQAWFALGDYYGQRDEPAKARDAFARGLMLKEEAPPTQVAAYVDLLIRAGDYDKAEEILPTLEREPAIANLLRGRLLLARGEPGKALDALDEGLRLWPDHSVARWLAARAAEQMGDYDRALTEYLESVRNDPGNRDAMLGLLRLLEALGRYRDALPALVRYQREKPRDPEMMVQAMRFASHAGQRDVVEQAARRLGEIPGQQGVVVAEFAAIRARRAGPAAGVEAIRAAGLDLTRPINGPALSALVQYLTADGESAAALAATDAALAAHPDQALFHELRAQALRAQGERAAAREALERALALEPERAPALAALAALTAEPGGREAAIALYDRADRADPEEPAYAWAAIQLMAASGEDGTELDGRLEALLSRHGIHAAAANLLAQRLLVRDPERAFALARRAVRFRGGPDALDTLGRLQLERGDAERAAKTLEHSLQLRPDSPSTRYWLGRARFAAGDADGAQRAFIAALAADDFPEKDDAAARLAHLNAD
ncbi:MAG TPA: tetratricopeptide repeat protein [Myxococcota bacterium]